MTVRCERLQKIVSYHLSLDGIINGTHHARRPPSKTTCSPTAGCPFFMVECFCTLYSLVGGRGRAASPGVALAFSLVHEKQV